MTESRKSPYFWKMQIAYWVAYTLLQGIVGWALIAGGIIFCGSEVLLLELILLKSAYGFVITCAFRPLFIWIHSRKWHPLQMTLVLLALSLTSITVELLLITQIPILREHFKPLMGVHPLGTNVMLGGILYGSLLFCTLGRVLFRRIALF